MTRLLGEDPLKLVEGDLLHLHSFWDHQAFTMMIKCCYEERGKVGSNVRVQVDQLRERDSPSEAPGYIP